MDKTILLYRLKFTTIIALIAVIGAIVLWYYVVRELQAVRAEYTDLQPKVEQLKIDTVNLETEKKRLIADKNQLDAENKNLVNAQRKLEQDKKELEDKIKNLSPEFAAAEKKLKDVEQKLADAAQDGATLKRQLDKANEDSKKKTDEIAHLKSDIENKNAELDEFKKELGKLQGQIGNDGILQAVKNLAQKIEKYETDIKESRNQLAQSQLKTKELQGKLNECKDAYRNYVGAAMGKGDKRPWYVQPPSYYGIPSADDKNF
jgi:chromosome segregation ATPase